ncbi:MAG: hypothetical protein LBE13_20995 [Bacteroidales bacterium]|nr:hypothetical protein [Bacteroidales bacterium]
MKTQRKLGRHKHKKSVGLKQAAGLLFAWLQSNICKNKCLCLLVCCFLWHITASVLTLTQATAANRCDISTVGVGGAVSAEIGYMLGGAVVGGASGYLGWAVAGSGIPMANTLGIMSSSFTNSVGTFMYTGGQTDVSISFGVGSYNFSKNEWGFLGKKGNSVLENIGYGLGAMANLADLGKAGNLLLNTEKKDVINHSAILDENGNRIISQGPCKNWIEPKGTIDHYLNRFLGGSGATNEYPIHGDNMIIKNVNVTTIKNYGKVLDFLTQRGKGVLPYSFLYSSCSTHTGLALNLAGIPTLFIHPYTVQASVWLWNAGITPALINNSYHLQNW